MIWTLDGDLIKTGDCLKNIDHLRHPTLEQFSIICSFIENTTFEFEPSADLMITNWADSMKEQSKSNWSFSRALRSDEQSCTTNVHSSSMKYCFCIFSCFYQHVNTVVVFIFRSKCTNGSSFSMSIRENGSQWISVGIFHRTCRIGVGCC